MERKVYRGDSLPIHQGLFSENNYSSPRQVVGNCGRGRLKKEKWHGEIYDLLARRKFT